MLVTEAVVEDVNIFFLSIVDVYNSMVIMYIKIYEQKCNVCVENQGYWYFVNP